MDDSEEEDDEELPSQLVLAADQETDYAVAASIARASGQPS